MFPGTDSGLIFIRPRSRGQLEMEKLDGQVMAHIPSTAERQLKGLARIKGVKASEYVRDLIIDHLDEELRQFQLRQEVFGGEGLDQKG